MGTDELRPYLDQFVATARADREAVRSVEDGLGVALPSDVVNFHLEVGAGEGFIGEQYIVVWGLGEIRPFNEEYEIDTYAPGILLFGSDGGGELFGFDLRESARPVVIIPCVGMELDTARLVSSSFHELIVHFGNGQTPIEQP